MSTMGSLVAYRYIILQCPVQHSGLFFDCASSQRSSSVNIDNHPESVVRVEASNVHALFNFLLTSKTTITTTGAHAGIPPTLVAPVAFEGSTLKSLTVRILLCSIPPLLVCFYYGLQACHPQKVATLNWTGKLWCLIEDIQYSIILSYLFILASSRQGKVQCTNMLVGKWCNSTHLTSVDPFFLKPYATSVVSSNKHNTATSRCIQILLCPLVASMLPQ